MNILILSCHTGEGHNSAAKAVGEELSALNHKYEIVDPSLIGGNKTKSLPSICYNTLIKKKPSLFGVVYKAGKWYDSTKLVSPIYLVNATHAKAVWKYIEDNKFDAAVCTHLFGMETLTAIRKRLGKYIPSYGILTDYTVVPFFCDAKIDGYFIPHEELKPSLAMRGIPEEKIFPTGIPVSPKFHSKMTKEEARIHLGMPKDKRIFVIMCGGIGGGNVIGLCEKMLSKVGNDALIYVLTGRNNKLRESVIERFEENNNIIVQPFTTEANIFMKAADVLLSKPGGLSSTEAAVSGVPLIHIGAIPGCETDNTKFFEEHGLSIAADDISDAAEKAVKLESDKLISERMRAAQSSVINPYAARDIALKITQ